MLDDRVLLQDREVAVRRLLGLLEAFLLELLGEVLMAHRIHPDELGVCALLLASSVVVLFGALFISLGIQSKVELRIFAVRIFC